MRALIMDHRQEEIPIALPNNEGGLAAMPSHPDSLVAISITRPIHQQGARRIQSRPREYKARRIFASAAELAC
jgi:hypothetical protein